MNTVSTYDSRTLPAQAPQPDPRAWIDRQLNLRLPWGNTEDVAPPTFIESTSPQFLRQKEKLLAEYEAGLHQEIKKQDFHQVIDQERFRYADLSTRAMFWLYLQGLGKTGVIFLTPITIITHILFLFGPGEDRTWAGALVSDIPIFLTFIGIPLACWGIGSAVNRWLPDWVVRPSKGPLFEFNRTTGLITVFKYGRDTQYRKTGKPDEDSAPFYEFDAYVTAAPDRQGLPLNYLRLNHRYRKLSVDLTPLLGGPTRTRQDLFAFWDMWQNFMDTSHPLPDIPLWEEHRAKDSVTAEHDRQTQRPSRHWRDMDDDQYEAAKREMAIQIAGLDTLSRPNLMARHVQYID